MKRQKLELSLTKPGKIRCSEPTSFTATVSISEVLDYSQHRPATDSLAVRAVSSPYLRVNTARNTGFNYLVYDCRKRFYHYHDTEPEGHVLGIKDVHVDHFSERGLVFTVDLPVSGEPGRRIDSFVLPHLITRKFMRGAGTRPDQAHFAAEHIEELRQFIQARRPK